MAKIFKHRTDVAYFDYKDFKTLQRYVNQYGQIETAKRPAYRKVNSASWPALSSVPATLRCYHS
jgi:hypothetical protein